MNRSPSFWEVVLFLVVFAAVVFAAKAIHAGIVYDDWTCGFARCVRVTP